MQTDFIIQHFEYLLPAQIRIIFKNIDRFKSIKY